MEEINIRESFTKKLDQTYLSKWLTLDAAALIENAEKIAVIKQTYQQLKDEDSNFYTDCMAYFIPVENPLAIISDDLGMLSIVDRDDLGHALWQLAITGTRIAIMNWIRGYTTGRDDDEMEV
jgi:hypothetical protein